MKLLALWFCTFISIGSVVYVSSFSYDQDIYFISYIVFFLWAMTLPAWCEYAFQGDERVFKQND